mmetsp:Transcript_21788/g.62292  ORF Transcript_21788/g.62292 Transcript_21788/m.62292 type:complete len:218 (-) Transcript_21788:158-811(-)
MVLFLGASLSAKPSVMRSLVMCTSSGASVRRMQSFRAVSPSKFVALKSAWPLSINTRVASSAPCMAACINGVQPILSVTFASTPRSRRHLTQSGSSSAAAQCKAVKPSLSLAARFAPASTSEGSRCQWPSRAAMLRGATPSISTAFTSMCGSTSSLLPPSRAPKIKFTRSRWPGTQAWCKMPRPKLSTAPASHHGPFPLPRSRTNDTKQAICPPCAA